MNYLSLFAGIGGFDLGLNSAGFNGVGQVEIDTVASRVLARHFPEVPRHDDVQTCLEWWLGQDRPEVDLICGGFPCFTAGTMILTWDGYRPIEELAVGDLVLTHLGRWRPVTAVMSRRATETLLVRGQGLPETQTTHEHPYYVRRHHPRAWDAALGRWTGRRFDPPEWLEAGKLTADHRLGQVLPVDPVADEHDEDFWYLVGRYLADGWRATSNGKGRVVISAGRHEADQLEARIRRVVPCTRVEERTVVKFHLTRTGLHRWLEPFGDGAADKRLPGWTLALGPDQARGLLLGWLDGDGTHTQGMWKGATTSRALALGMALLAQRVFGVVASIHEVTPWYHRRIEGRVVNQQPWYQVVIPPTNRMGVVDGNYGWKKLREIRKAGPARVYNISVEEDESYVADGAIVHNCQDVSVAGRRAGLAGERSGLFFAFARAIGVLRPRWILVENVTGLLNSRQGRDFGVVLTTLGKLGYGVSWRVLDSQHFGIPQRRKRVYLVGHLGAACPPEILFEFAGGQGDPAPGRAAGADLAGAAAPGPGGPGGGRARGTVGPLMAGASSGAGWRVGADEAAAGHLVVADHANALCAHPSRLDPNAETFVAVSQDPASTITASAGHHGHSSPRGDGTDNLVIQGLPDPRGTVGPLLANTGGQRTTDMNVPLVPVYTLQDGGRAHLPKSQNGLGVSDEGVAYTVDANSRHAVAYEAPAPCAAEAENDEDCMCVLPADHGQDGHLYWHLAETCEQLERWPTEDEASQWLEDTRPATFRKQRRAKAKDDYETWTETDIANTLNAFENHNAERTTHAVVYNVQPVSSLRIPNALSAKETGVAEALTAIGPSRRSDRGDLVVSGPVTQRIGKGVNTTVDDGALVVDGPQGTHAVGLTEGVGTTAVPVDLRQATRRSGETGVGTPGTGVGEAGDPAFAVTSVAQAVAQPVLTNTIVRRLTPRECERLQGFPDDYTALDDAAKAVSDTARYRFLGNAVSVPVVAWIAHRIAAAEAAEQAAATDAELEPVG